MQYILGVCRNHMKETNREAKEVEKNKDGK